MNDLNAAYLDYRQHPTESTTTDLFTACGRYALKLAHVLGCDAADKPDEVQSVLMYVWENLSQYDASRGEFSAWFRAMARHHMMNLYRSRKPYRDHEHVDIGDNEPVEESGATELRLDISVLNPTQRHTLKVFVALRDFKQTANALGIAVVALRRRIYRIRQILVTK